MQTRGQPQQQSAHKELVLGLAEESKSILLELGSILNQRYHNRGPTQQTQRVLRRKNELVSRLEQFVSEQQSSEDAQEDPQATVEGLQKELQDQRAAFEQQRARLEQQATVTLNAQTELSSSLNRVLPQLRGLLDAYDRERGQHVDLTQGTTTTSAATANVACSARTVTLTQSSSSTPDLTQRLTDLQTQFDAERAQLLEQASDAANTQQDITRRNLREREAALTCPISLDLFENPVVTECCGRTFSSEALTQALRRNSQCPVCRSRRTEAGTPPIERIRFLEQQLRDLEQQLRDACSSSVRAQVQYMQQLVALGKTLQLKDEVVTRLNRQVNELQNAYVAERQRADQLQRALVNGAACIQGEAQLRELLRTQQLQTRRQQVAFSEATTRFMEQRQRDLTIQERLQRKVELHEMSMQDQNTLLEKQRTRLPEQTANSHGAQEDARLNVRNQGQRCIADPVDANDAEATATTVFTEDMNCGMKQRLEEQLREFEQERAQLLEQASDAAKTHHDVSLANLREREAVLTCPISLDLFDGPVVSECCGKTFSSLAIAQKLEESLLCPSCHAPVVRLHPNRDMTLLVKLHRLERSIIGVSEGLRMDHDAEDEQNHIVRSERSTTSPHNSIDASTRQIRQRERRNQRILGRSVVYRRQSPRRSAQTTSVIPGSAAVLATASSTAESGSSALRRHQSSPNATPDTSSIAASVNPLETFASWLEKNGQCGARERMARHRQLSSATSWDELRHVMDGSDSESD
ncbi:hypothetical protein PR002_g4613 [Phytophthora rubi]|uniref:SP-RING-type domain-containing protein n=1 Tax=Phytophthora rubi TaxID=129364 RepID=A0A6A3NJD6_9STRA|nr:hypothetical protein PR002_g4613 [Phytophthora rubi]